MDDFRFCGCHVSATHGSPAGGRRRQVVVNGRRVRTVDLHAHCIIRKALELSGTKPPMSPLYIDAHQRIREMDDQGVDVEALSIVPFWYGLERELAAEIVRINNDALAELCAQHPERFVALASVALQFPELAVEHLVHAVKKLGLRGAIVGTRVGDAELADPRFHPFWAKAEELGVLIFIHSLPDLPELAHRLKGNGFLSNVIGNPLDTTIALSHLIFEGTLDRYPGLKLCSAHGGGYLPSYSARSDHGCRTFPHRCDSTITLRKKPSEYLREMYFDSLVFTPEALRHLAAEVGAGHIVMGSDHPAGWTTVQVDHILETPGFTDEERAAMLGGTAAKLLGIDYIKP
jgi:aminocarboxymuconate-semialdehyde decarboxylase